jgi:hypothetical protein
MKTFRNRVEHFPKLNTPSHGQDYKSDWLRRPALPFADARRLAGWTRLRCRHKQRQVAKFWLMCNMSFRWQPCINLYRQHRSCPLSRLESVTVAPRGSIHSTWLRCAGTPWHEEGRRASSGSGGGGEHVYHSFSYLIQSGGTTNLTRWSSLLTTFFCEIELWTSTSCHSFVSWHQHGLPRKLDFRYSQILK